MCGDGCNLLFVEIKALIALKGHSVLSGGAHHGLAEKRIYRRSGYLSCMIVIMHNITCIYKLGKIID